jgi:hypothetical protein
MRFWVLGRSRCFSKRPIDRMHFREELVQFFEADLTWTITGSRIDVGVSFNEECVDAGGHGGAGKGGNETAVAA